jgi:GDP/UDP-N,N'-diacetylbacillosamine 2-epimerase (hydrolysing)
MRLLFLLGSRGEWGYIKPVIDEASKRGHNATICATNMTLLPNYGSLADEVAAAGYNVKHRILNSVEGGSRAAMAKSVGLLELSLVDVISQERPDWVILAGDRAEQLAAAVACAYTYTPTAHIQAGERSGNIDGLARHAIARLVHLHFAANKDAADRLIQSGEDPWRVYLTGAPQLDEINGGKLPTAGDAAYADIRPPGDFLLACFHPVTEQGDEVLDELNGLMNALSQQPAPIVWILPNNDAGGEVIRAQILSGMRGKDRAFANLRRDDYLALLRDCTAIVGNSSSGLLEAPTFGTPAVNVGRRQSHRVQGANVVNAPHGTSDEILTALRQVLERGSGPSLLAESNPYGDGRSSPRILDALETVARDAVLISKQIAY